MSAERWQYAKSAAPFFLGAMIGLAIIFAATASINANDSRHRLDCREVLFYARTSRDTLDVVLHDSFCGRP